MADAKPSQTLASKYIRSIVVEKETAAGSKLISINLTPEGERALTVEPLKRDAKT